MELILFDLIMVSLILIDIYNYERQVTPLTIVGSIFVFLINLNNLIVSEIYGFYKVTDHSLLVLLLFFFLIFGVDMAFGCLYRHTSRTALEQAVRFRSFRLVSILYGIGVLAYFLEFIRLSRVYGINGIKGKGGGILGHLTFLAYILGPITLDLAIKRKNKFNIILVIFINLVTLGIAVLFGGKYQIFINLTYFLLFFILKRDHRASIIKLIKLVVPMMGIAIAGFMVIYYIIPVITGAYQTSIDFAIRHMFDYLLGPMIANNYTISHSGQGNVFAPFAVFINIGKALVREGNYVNPIFPFVFPTSPIMITNVSGFFGDIIYTLGIPGALVYTLVIFFIINIFFWFYRSQTKYQLCFCYTAAILVFLFFGNFITVSGVVLPLILAFVLDTASIFRINTYHL